MNKILYFFVSIFLLFGVANAAQHVENIKEKPTKKSCTMIFKKALCFFLLLSQPAAAGPTYREFYQCHKYSSCNSAKMLEANHLLNQLAIKAHDNATEHLRAWDELRIITDVSAHCWFGKDDVEAREMLRKALRNKNELVRLNKN